MAKTPTQTENYTGSEIDPAQIVRRLRDPAVKRVWLIEGQTPWRGPNLDPATRAKVDTLDHEFRRIAQWRVRGLSFALYAR